MFLHFSLLIYVSIRYLILNDHPIITFCCNFMPPKLYLIEKELILEKFSPKTKEEDA
ncbi:hypothetical protein FACS18947_2120 [Bacteroidia bacterium]|nr:hypothetical protein FACS18947_2120 [Bacteroidia bacterium]